MSTAASSAAAPVPAAAQPVGRRVPGPLSLVVFVGLAAGAVSYAKWWPYAHKLAKVATTGAYPGKSILANPQASVTWHQAWHFTVAYGRSVWLALAAGLLIGAGVETLLSQSVLDRLTVTRAFRSSLAAGVLSLPCMMCTCCGAPIARSMRRRGIPAGPALSFWLGNPLLNPVVITILAIVLPWKYAAVRILIGAAVVFVGAPIVGRLVGSRRETASTAATIEPVVGPVVGPVDSPPARPLALSYVSALARLALVLVPEYFVVVLAVGALRGFLFPLGHSAVSWGVAVALIASLLAVLMVIPTGAEIPVVAGLIGAGFSPLVAGAVLVALPAISLPSMVMVGRDLSWRVTGAAAVMVTVAAVGAGGLAAAVGA